MAANNLLDKEVPLYHRFVDNQVLTDDQLNEVLDHINYQDKLTRTGLIGVGIVCGLKISTQGNSIILSRGIAVTTDGDILKMDTTRYLGYKPFKDENVLYEHFRDNETTIPFYELEENTDASDVEPLSSFSQETGIDNDRRVAILYLEHYLKDKEDCSPVDCNAQGREVVNRLRVLITSIENAKLIASKDSIFSGLLPATQKDILNKIDSLLPKRVVINSTSGSTYSALKNAYAVDFSGLENRLGQLSELGIFANLEAKSGIKINARLSKVTVGEFNFQYVYDFYKDLAAAYNELLQQVRDNFTICCPDPSAFPKHVLLGEVSFRPIYLRHRFYASPIHDQHHSINVLQNMFIRILQMIRHFSIKLTREVRITPSRGNHFSLGEKALPFYYDPQLFHQPEDLLNKWNSKSETPWNYYKSGYPNNNFEPLDYCLDDHDFYRIEGHVGMEISEAMKSVKQIRDQKGLAFDFIPIAVGQLADDATLDFEKYNMYFEDLQVILQAWNEEQKCMIAGTTRFFTGFSIVNKGLHLGYAAKMVEAEPVTAVAAMEATAEGVVLTTRKREAAANFLVARGSSPKKVNNVFEYVEEDKDSVGKLYKDVWKNSDGASDIQIKARDVLTDKIKDWEEEYKVIIAHIPAELLGKLKSTEDNKLLNIEDFTEENLEKYLTALQAQCDAAKEAKKKLQAQVDKENSAIRGRAYIENYFFVLNRMISSCCLVERVKVLYEAILERRQELLGKMVLKEYTQSHPGTEHKAGVERGGTFILLYYSTLREKLQRTGNIRLAETAIAGDLQRLSAEEVVKRESRERTGLSFARREEVLGGGVMDTGRLAALEGRFELATDVIATSRSNLSHGVVVGDLCLPYICCTDTPATTFVFPDQEIRLFIAEEHACVPFEGGAKNLLMEVSPANAAVTAYSGNKQLEDVILKTDSSYFFNPNKVPETEFGKKITFQVNGQNTAEELRVLRKPSAGFTVSEKISFRNDNTVAMITIRNTSKEIAEQVFTWNFGDGTNKEENAIEFSYAYQVKPNSKFNFTIELTAANSSCTDTAKEDIVIEVPGSEPNPESCMEQSHKDIEEGRVGVESELERNPDLLKEQNAFYAKHFVPLYKRIMEDPNGTFTGEHDTEIYDLVEVAQHSIESHLNVNLSTLQQKAYLHMYYENVLLYFYIQRCRETSITIRRGKKIASQWSDFTRNASDTFKEALLALLKEKSIAADLSGLRTALDDRLSGSLKEILDEVIKHLKSTLENN